VSAKASASETCPRSISVAATRVRDPASIGFGVLDVRESSYSARAIETCVSEESISGAIVPKTVCRTSGPLARTSESALMARRARGSRKAWIRRMLWPCTSCGSSARKARVDFRRAVTSWSLAASSTSWMYDGAKAESSAIDRSKAARAMPMLLRDGKYRRVKW
jgi:hypothetical protein